ncbi:MAG: polysaccharide biosynthesis/export family protein [Pseudomonadales bacterium]
MIRAILSILAACLACGCAPTAVAPQQPSDDEGFIFADEYRIGVGDSLAVHVYGHEDVTSTVTVRPDGNITIPIAGDLLVGGEIPEDVAKKVTEILSKYIRNPIVTVTVADISSSDYLSRVRVTGAVETPQSIGFKNGMTVMDVVLEAGGVNEFANAARTRLYRQGQEPMAIRLDRILSGRDLSTNVRLRPGDVISVPERAF